MLHSYIWHSDQAGSAGLEFNQQWLPMGIILGQSLSALSVRLSPGWSPLFKVFGALLPSPRSKTGVSSFSPRLLAIFFFSYVLSHISDRAPTILFCFDRIHDKVFCCSEMLRRVATELVKKMKPVFRARANSVCAFFYLRTCAFSPLCSGGRAYIHTSLQHYVSAPKYQDKKKSIALHNGVKNEQT